MATSIVNSGQTGATTTGTLSITSATAGNILVAFIGQDVGTSAVTGSDNVSGPTGWTTNSNYAYYNGTSATEWVAIKVAVGGETSLNPTAGSGGTTVNTLTLAYDGSSNVTSITKT
jgi:hypothetical protein